MMSPPRRRAHRRPVLLFLLTVPIAAVVLAAASLAAATAIGGAKYTGTASDLAQIQITVSSDGTLITGYKFTDVRAGTCTFTSEADPRTWPGVPIVRNSFAYNPNPWFSFHGKFSGTQSAHGTLRLQQGATSSTPACDTGVLSWDLTTGSKPPAGKPPVPTMLTLRKLSSHKLGGRLTSPSSLCRRHRVVTIWQGRQRVGSTKPRRRGRFSFALTGAMHGKQVRVSTASSRSAGARCAASTSLFITA